MPVGPFGCPPSPQAVFPRTSSDSLPGSEILIVGRERDLIGDRPSRLHSRVAPPAVHQGLDDTAPLQSSPSSGPSIRDPPPNSQRTTKVPQPEQDGESSGKVVWDTRTRDTPFLPMVPLTLKTQKNDSKSITVKVGVCRRKTYKSQESIRIPSRSTPHPMSNDRTKEVERSE